MKIRIQHQDQRGSAVLVVFVLLTLMVALLAANNRTLLALDSNMEIVNRKQLKHWNTPTPTNHSPAANR